MQLLLIEYWELVNININSIYSCYVDVKTGKDVSDTRDKYRVNAAEGTSNMNNNITAVNQIFCQAEAYLHTSPHTSGWLFDESTSKGFWCFLFYCNAIAEPANLFSCACDVIFFLHVTNWHRAWQFLTNSISISFTLLDRSSKGTIETVDSFLSLYETYDLVEYTYHGLVIVMLNQMPVLFVILNYRPLIVCMTIKRP